MPVSFFETEFEVNESNVPEVNADAEVRLGTDLRVKAKSAGAEVVLNRAGVNLRQETIKYESEDGSETVAGPSAGAEAGYKLTEKGGNLAAKAELSLARAEKSFQVTENVDAYVCVNLNVNTGIQAGAEGFEVNFLGFGFTLGVGGRWTVNTPIGSVGGKGSDSGSGSSSSVPVSNDRPNLEMMKAATGHCLKEGQVLNKVLNTYTKQNADDAHSTENGVVCNSVPVSNDRPNLEMMKTATGHCLKDGQVLSKLLHTYTKQNADNAHSTENDVVCSSVPVSNDRPNLEMLKAARGHRLKKGQVLSKLLHTYTKQNADDAHSTENDVVCSSVPVSSEHLNRKLVANF